MGSTGTVVYYSTAVDIVIGCHDMLLFVDVGRKYFEERKVCSSASGRGMAWFLMVGSYHEGNGFTSEPLPFRAQNPHYSTLECQ